MNKLYKVDFNNYGSNYVIAKDWNEAGEKIIKVFGKDCEVKKIEYVCGIFNGKKTGLQLIHL